jgi:HD-GYP domain-containing protein (c-di-GMP phosphodiesterase class II)
MQDDKPKSEHLSQRTQQEIQKLLNLKVPTMGKLNILEDDKASPPGTPTSLRSVVDQNFLKKPLNGKRGFELLAESRNVALLENRLPALLKETLGQNAFKRNIRQISAAERNAVYKADIQRQYQEALKQVRSLYYHLFWWKPIRIDKIYSLIQDFITVFIKDRVILLNLINRDNNKEEYLFDHALHVCLLCINIATACDYSRNDVMKIGAAGLLADIGMLHLPKKIRFKQGKYTQEEFYDIQKHPIIGLALLERIERVPQTIPVSAYQHHERISGVGYTKNRKGRFIHKHAKIVAIADVYHALCKDRPHRKGLLPHQALVKIIKMAKAQLLDMEIINRFLSYVSLYPIGSFVRITTGEIAKVTGANENSPGHPALTVVTDKSGALLPPNAFCRIDLNRNTQVKIQEALDFQHKGLDIMDGF